jgi:adenine-specific DNA-methyltransferase
MSKDLLKVVIDQGVRDNLNTFFSAVSNDYSEIGDDLSIYDDDRFANFQRTGEIVFNPNEKLVVVTAEVAEDLTERSGKKNQYEKAK